jgi:hypothetical protein
MDIKTILRDTQYTWREGNALYIDSIAGEFSLRAECGGTAFYFAGFTDWLECDVADAFIQLISRYPLLRPRGRANEIFAEVARCFYRLFGPAALFLDLQESGLTGFIEDRWLIGRRVHLSLSNGTYPALVNNCRVSGPWDVHRIVKIYLREDVLLRAMVRCVAPHPALASTPARSESAGGPLAPWIINGTLTVVGGEIYEGGEPITPESLQYYTEAANEIWRMAPFIPKQGRNLV